MKHLLLCVALCGVLGYNTNGLLFCILLACGPGVCSYFTSRGGVLLSPNFPRDYGNNRNCNITVSAPIGSKFLLSFASFIVEQDYDFLSVEIFLKPSKLLTLIALTVKLTSIISHLNI